MLFKRLCVLAVAGDKVCKTVDAVVAGEKVDQRLEAMLADIIKRDSENYVANDKVSANT